MKTDSSSGHPAYRADIDGLRAIAILSVLGFHAFPAWVPGGFIGVDIFFVISGFLISGILLANLQADRFSLIDFYGRRIRRIFPALILVLLVSGIAGFFVLWPGEYRQLGKHITGGAGFIVNGLLWSEDGYFDSRAETKPLLHLWSLGIEEQFYIFWPLMLAMVWKWKHRAGALIACVIAASFAANIWWADQRPIFDFYSPFSRFWELLTGGALAWAAQKNRLSFSSRWGTNFLSVGGLVFMIAALFVLDKDMDFPGWLALLPVCGAAMVIAAGEGAILNRRLLAARPMVAIGLISYPLYLWHWPLLSFAQILSGEPPARIVRIAMITLSFVLATATYLWLEKPIRLAPVNRRSIFLLLAMMAALGVAGAIIWADKGLPMRYADGGVTGNALDGDRLIATWQHSVRMHQCHIQDDTDRRSPDCIEKQRPLLFLWGDSHAAALYPGLKYLQTRHGFGIAQVTQAGCPPISDVLHLSFRKDCNEINARILDQAADLQPAVILLAAAWKHHDYPMENADIIARLTKTVATIRKRIPTAHIIVVGPEPRWFSPLPAIYRRSLTLDERTPLQYSSDHLDPAFAELDSQMAKALAAQGDVYLSPQAQLCRETACLTRLGDGLDSLTFIDEEHVTTVASVFLIQKFSPILLDALGLKN